MIILKNVSKKYNNDDVISTTCIDWSENTQWTDNLRIGLMLKEFNDWIK